MQIAVDSQDFLSYLACIQCLLSYTPIELNSPFWQSPVGRAENAFYKKNKMKSLRTRRPCLQSRSLKQVVPQLRLTKPEPSLLLGSSGSAPTIVRRLSPTATTAQSLYSGSQMDHGHFFKTMAPLPTLGPKMRPGIQQGYRRDSCTC